MYHLLLLCTHIKVFLTPQNSTIQAAFKQVLNTSLIDHHVLSSPTVLTLQSAHALWQCLQLIVRQVQMQET